MPGSLVDECVRRLSCAAFMPSTASTVVAMLNFLASCIKQWLGPLIGSSSAASLLGAGCVSIAVEKDGVRSLLKHFSPIGGGGVRGLPPSTSHYSLCPRILDQRFTASNPGTALDVHHSLLELCRVVCGHDLLVARGCNQARGAQLGFMLEQMLAQEGLMGCPPLHPQSTGQRHYSCS